MRRVVDPAPSSRHPVRLAALSVGQVVSWGILYYALIVAAPAIATDTGWSLVTVTGAFSGGLVVSALAGIVVGRLLDERGPRVVMTVGALVGTAGLVIVALAPDPLVFAAGWAVCGLAQSSVLYQAAFTVIIRRHGDERRTPLTIVTLAGGLASTVFAPVTALLLGVLDWRGTFLVLAGMLAVITVPLHWFSLERSWGHLPPRRDDGPAHTVSAVVRTRRFWLLELTMITLTIALFSATLAVVPLLTEKGLSFELAAVGLGLVGAGQVVGRVIFLARPHQAPPWVLLVTVAALAAVALGLLAVVPGPAWLLIGIGVVAGAVRGAYTLVQASAVADRWGTRNYGSINGAFAAPITIAAALSPAIGPAVAAGVGSFSVMAAVMAGAAVVAAVTARMT